MDHWYKLLGVDESEFERCQNSILEIEYIDSKRFCEEPRIVWLGHASFLILWKEEKILIDPVFSKWIGIAKRRLPIPAKLSTIKPTAILLSHSHMDHMDTGCLRAFPDPPIFLPQKSERFLPKSIRRRASPILLNRPFSVGSVSIRPVVAKHGGWRYPWQKGYFACGFILSDGTKTIYYSGDTAWGDHFEMLSKEENVDIALLPIGAYAPRWFLKTRHMNPAEAIATFEILGASVMIPFHFATYRLSLEPMNEPFNDFIKLAKAKDIRWQLPLFKN